MDEGFRPLWFEDVDFLRRLRSAGYRVRYVPLAAARHKGGASVGLLPEDFRVVWWYGSLLRYSCKHFRPAGRLTVAAAVICGCFLRMVFGSLRRWKTEPVTVYGKVIRLACLGLFSGRSGEAGSTPVLARQ
jgi:GT2 family glycosyltransferase